MFGFNHVRSPFTALALSLFCSSIVHGDPTFEDRLLELENKIQSVSAEVEKSKGYVLQAGRVDVQIASWFADYIRWELDHPEITAYALDGDRRFRKLPYTAEDTRARYEAHIDHELTSSMRILENALSRMKENKDWPTPREIDWSAMTYQDERFRSEGKVVYPAGFNMLSRKFVDEEKFPEWKEKDEALRQEFIEQMNRLGVSIVAGGINPTRLIRKDGSVDKAEALRISNHHRHEGRFGAKVSVLFHWGGGRALEALWPGITKYGANGVALDIDHPGIPELVSRTLAVLMPEMKEADILAWDMANEPFFDMKDWSPHGLAKYHSWLEERYTDIHALNDLWQSSHQSFSEIPHPADKPIDSCSPAERYDRVIYHNRRVTDFFGLVAREIRIHIPDAAIHIKVQDNNSLGPRPFAVVDGMDRESMTPFVDMHGLDTRPLPVTEPRMAADGYDETLYSFHWLGQSFLYDYLGSLEPKRPIVDFEYHSISINPIRVPKIAEGHAEATLWLAHLHGLIGNKMWHWQRRYGPGDPFPEEYFRQWFYASISTQPLMAAEYFHTMRDLNIHAEHVDALASVHERPVRILVSKPSYIHNPAHIAALHRVYEGLCFHGLPIGFLTEKTLQRNGVPGDCELLLIPEATHLHKETVTVLDNSADRVRMLRYGKQPIRYNPQGVPHPTKFVENLNKLPCIPPADAASLSRKLAGEVSGPTEQLEVRVSLSGQDHAFGVMQRQITRKDKTILMLVNVRPAPVKMEIRDSSGKPVEAFDLLNRETVDGNKFEMPLKKVRLLEINHAPSD